MVLLCYAPKSKNGCEQFIISTINSLCIDSEYLNSPGIVTSYAFPPEGRKAISLQIGGKQIKSSLDKSDEEAAKFVVDLEYAVLNLYANHKMWKEAWQRYYRMIYRDNAGRLEQTAADVYNAVYPELKTKYHTRFNNRDYQSFVVVLLSHCYITGDYDIYYNFLKDPRKYIEKIAVKGYVRYSDQHKSQWRTLWTRKGAELTFNEAPEIFKDGEEKVIL